MIKQVILFETEDGKRFETAEEAEAYQESVERLDLIRCSLDVEGGSVTAEDVLQFINKYTKGWK